MKKEIEMKFEKSVKSTFKYLEVTSTIPALHSLYIRQSFFSNEKPDNIKITIEW